MGGGELRCAHALKRESELSEPACEAAHFVEDVPMKPGGLGTGDVCRAVVDHRSRAPWNGSETVLFRCFAGRSADDILAALRGRRLRDDRETAA